MPDRAPMDDVCDLPESPSTLVCGHELEECVHRELLSHPELRFSTLVIRRIRSGVCLEGVLDAPADPADVDLLVRRVAGVDRVLNRLVVRSGVEE